jgi:dCMP deaminase
VNPQFRMSRDTLLNSVAQTFALRSTCTRAAVGAVISREGRILSTGYNGAPKGMDHCTHECNCGKFTAVMAKGQHAYGCPTESPCVVAVHAEANAIAFAAKFGVPTDLTELHTTMAPCYVCAQLIINAGIIRVMYVRPYRDMSGVDLLHSANVEVIEA